MIDNLLETLYKYSELIANCDTPEQLKESSLFRDKFYNKYVRFDKCFWTVKLHPGEKSPKMLVYPDKKNLSEFFKDLTYVWQGIGHSKYDVGTFIWDEEDDPFGRHKLKTETKHKGFPFVQVFGHTTELIKGHYGSFRLIKWKTGHLLIGTAPSPYIGEDWLSFVQIDIQPTKEIFAQKNNQKEY